MAGQQTATDIRRVSPDRLEVQAVGSLDETRVLEWERELRTQLRHCEPETLGILLSLEAMTDYSLQAREVLVRVQTFLGGKASCTAYVADTPERRALALWVRHHATGGPSVAIYATRELAQRYLDGEHGAISALRPCAADAVAAADDTDASSTG
jgi:hypothetical protein